MGNIPFAFQNLGSLDFGIRLYVRCAGLTPRPPTQFLKSFGYRIESSV
jgi:hypothetical protein